MRGYGIRIVLVIQEMIVAVQRSDHHGSIESLYQRQTNRVFGYAESNRFALAVE